MSAQMQPALDDSERRVAPRTKTLKRAKILFNNNCSTFDCIVRNISATGALLTIDEAAHLPREFNVRIGEEKAIRLAKLVYRRGMFAGIHFLDGAEASQADQPSGAAPAHAEPAEAWHGGIRRLVAEPLPHVLADALPWARFEG